MATTSSVLDINSIVSQLMAAERRPLTKLAAQEAGYQAKLSAYGSVKGAVSSFQAALQALNTPSKFQSVTATASDSAVFSASATSTAVPGTYSLEVSSLAQPQKLVAAGQASSSAAIGAGTATTVTFDFGPISGGAFADGVYSGASFVSNGGGTKSITIDSSNNSLQACATRSMPQNWALPPPSSTTAAARLIASHWRRTTAASTRASRFR